MFSRLTTSGALALLCSGWLAGLMLIIGVLSAQINIGVYGSASTAVLILCSAQLVLVLSLIGDRLHLLGKTETFTKKHELWACILISAVYMLWILGWLLKQGFVALNAVEMTETWSQIAIGAPQNVQEAIQTEYMKSLGYSKLENLCKLIPLLPTILLPFVRRLITISFPEP